VPVTLTLKKPITVEDKQYTHLVLRDCDGGALRLLDRSGLLALVTQMGTKMVELRAAKIKAGMSAELADAEAVTEALPPGVIDKAGPVIANLAGVSETVIDRLSGDDYIDAFGALMEVMPQGGPLSRPTNTTA
jgi:hypothetical protein